MTEKQEGNSLGGRGVMLPDYLWQGVAHLFAGKEGRASVASTSLPLQVSTGNPAS